jgi:hypothetical protein
MFLPHYSLSQSTTAKNDVMCAVARTFQTNSGSGRYFRKLTKQSGTVRVGYVGHTPTSKRRSTFPITAIQFRARPRSISARHLVLRKRRAEHRYPALVAEFARMAP